MGVPVDTLLCASNDNKILTDFLRTGVYDTHRDFHKTFSPSMDILISSNLERLVFELLDRDDQKTAELMGELKTTGAYSIDPAILQEKVPYLMGGFATQEETVECITAVSKEYDYVMDPHTAVAFSVVDDYLVDTEDKTPMVVVSTASPFKFPCVVSRAVGKKEQTDEVLALETLSDLTGEPIPAQIQRLQSLPKRFTKVIDKTQTEKCIFDYLGE